MKKNLVLLVLGFLAFLQVCYSQNSGQKTLPDTTIDQILFLDSMEDWEEKNGANNLGIRHWTRRCSYDQGRSNFEKITPTNDIDLCNDSAYILVFQDNFDTKLDKTFWNNAMEELQGSACDYWAPNGWTDHDVAENCDNKPHRTEQWYKQENAFTENGVLKLKTEEDKDHIIREWSVWKNNQRVQMSKQLQFNSGRIDSRFEFQYGIEP